MKTASNNGNLLFLLFVISAGFGAHWYHKDEEAPAVSQEDFFAQNPLRQKLFKDKKKLFSKTIEATKMYFKGDYGSNKHWQQGIEESEEEREHQKELFGYALNIEHIIDNHPAIRKSLKHPTIYLHGWADNKNSAKLLKKYLLGLPGDIVIFDFPDAHGFLSMWRRAAFGQIPDVLPALYAINYTYEHLKPHAIDLYGVSRGGATTINALRVLYDKSGAFDEELKRIGISERRRAELLRAIERGTIVLDCPLRDMNHAVANKFPGFLSRLSLKLLSGMSRYDETGLQANDSVRELNGLKLNVLLHFQHDDNMVTNDGEADFYLALQQNNPKTTFLVLGDDGGHLHSHASLSRTVHSFKKMFGGSYDPRIDQLYTNYIKGAPSGTIESILLQPRDAHACISQFHNLCLERKK